jgi:hypothetical protein
VSEWERGAPAVQRVAVVADVTVVFFQLGGLMWFFAGVGEYDELVLGECASALVEVIGMQVNKARGLVEV